MGLDSTTYHNGDVHVVDTGGAELNVEQDSDDNSKIVIVPMGNCMIEIVYSDEYKRLVGVVREIPSRD